MTVTINAGQQLGADSFEVDVLTQSTATAEQSVSVRLAISTLAGGTATGFTRNRYVVPAGREGDRKLIWNLATGESMVRFGAATTDLLATGGVHYFNVSTATGGMSPASVLGVFQASATGAFVLTTANHFLEALFMNGFWHLRGGLATLATAT